MVYYRLTHSCIDNKPSNLIVNDNASLGFLPVELTHFEAVATAPNTTHITWKTETETNNNYFSLYRSFNGVDFKEIATIAGAGTSSVTQRYDFYDHTAGSSSIVYYKLEQTDYNGSTTSSNIISVYNTQNAEQAIEIFEITKLLNNNGSVLMELQFPNEQQHAIIIYGLRGKCVYSNTFVNTQNATIHISNLTKGTYIVECVSNNQEQSKKIQI